MVPFPQFYRRHGIRRIDNLLNPPLHSTSGLLLPRGAVVHHLDLDAVAIGPDPENLFFRNHKGRVLVEHIQELVDPIGSPRRNQGIFPGALRRDYHRRFRTLRPLHDFNKSSRDIRTIITENYSHLPQLFRYMRSIYGNFYRWHNVYKAMFTKLNERCSESDRQHYIQCSLPKRLPGIALLRRGDVDYTKLPRPLLSLFSQPEYMFLLEMWKWLGINRQNSLLNIVDSSHYDKVNLVWVESGSFCVMNLGHISRIIGVGEDEDDQDEGSSRIQRQFLRFCISLFEQRTTAPTSTEIDDDKGDEPIVKDEDVNDEDVNDDVSDSDVDEGDTPPWEDDVLEEGDEESLVDNPDDIITDMGSIDEESLTADLKRLDELAEQLERDADVHLEPIVFRENAIDSVVDKVKSLADDGNLSPAQVRRYETMVKKHREIKNPFGGEAKTLDEFIKVDPKSIAIDPSEIKIPKVAGVTDESLLESTLNVFDSKYIKEVMLKDVCSAALSVQRAGVVVTDFNVEEVEDAANHYQVMTMRLNPIDGEPSTIRFRIPVVEESGEFVANNVKSRLRKQRADVPIRKVSPSSVALTSYYAKVFVDRSEKSVVNYPNWLLKQIVAKGLDDQDKTITKLHHTSTFVNNVKLPRIYTILAHKLRSFNVNGDYHIYVDYTRRNDVFGEEFIKSSEKDGMTFIGVRLNVRGRSPILVDENNVFYAKLGDGLEVLGTIETLCGLDSSKAPVEIAEFRLFSKNIPVVMALGYRFGLTRLMNLLDVRPRRVPVGMQTNIEPSEYAVRFSDETLIFPKDNQRAQLIIAGLNRYHRSVAKYNVDAYDDTEVFENIMEENGHRIGFIRELELAMDMFVDPITYELLKEMGEPVQLDLLLIRACELLLTDDHPDETDMRYMRVRGYERISGAVYSEMIKGIRKFRSRGVGSAAKVEINPEAVWMNINQDPSISQVEESNPIMNLKEKELITYMGTGGRSTRSMVKHTRAYHKSDMGVISEATVDSGAVGVNAYLSANPQFSNLRGMTNPYVEGNAGNSSMLSTSALLAPGADVDD